MRIQHEELELPLAESLGHSPLVTDHSFGLIDAHHGPHRPDGSGKTDGVRASAAGELQRMAPRIPGRNLRTALHTARQAVMHIGRRPGPPLRTLGPGVS